MTDIVFLLSFEFFDSIEKLPAFLAASNLDCYGQRNGHAHKDRDQHFHFFSFLLMIKKNPISAIWLRQFYACFFQVSKPTIFFSPGFPKRHWKLHFNEPREFLSKVATIWQAFTAKKFCKQNMNEARNYGISIWRVFSSQ
jgi:hypothetical protein